MNRTVLWRISAIISGSAGILLLAVVFFPILSYERQSLNQRSNLLSPLAENQPVTKLSSMDYTKASNWFVDSRAQSEFISSNISFYKVSIPKLGIKEAMVTIGGEDLAESLIQYPGSVPPGKKGNTVIFGHSILPQFFNPEEYISIFSTLPQLKKGDLIKVDYDGVNYKYRVEEKFEVKPTEIEILEQNQGNSYLSLITCVPPGHPLKPRRLVVRAKIVPLEVSNL